MIGDAKRTDITFVVTNEISVRFVEPIVESLASQGGRVGLITNFGTGEPSSTVAPFVARHVHVPMKREPSPLKDLVDLWRLRRALKSMMSTLVHVSTPKAGLLGVIAARSLRLTVIYEVRGYRAEGLTGPKGALLRSLERLTLRLATQVVFESESLRIAMEKDGCDASGKSVVLGRGGSVGVDTARFVPAQRAPGSDPVCGFVGRIHRDKGIEDLIHVFRTLRVQRPTLTMIVVGGIDPSDRSSGHLERMCRDTEGVQVLGAVKDVVPHLQAMDVLIMPSRREGLPTAPLEAQACGVPVVGYRATGMIDAVEHGVGGYLAPVGDRNELLRLTALLLDDTELRRETGRQGRQFVSTHFESHEVVHRHVQHIRTMRARFSSGRDNGN